MNDLISRQAALIKSFESALLEHKDGSIIQCSPEFVSMAVEILKELKAWQWIPCSERLPECEGVNLYILTIADEDGTMTTMGWYSKDRQQWYDEEGWPIRGNALVTAWKPLPEPYKEGEA